MFRCAKTMIRLSLLLAALLSVSAFSDEIYLSNGQEAITKILDTTGCSVKILRRDNEVKINKKLISQIIWNGDTIDYSDYKCIIDPMIKKAVRFRDTPKYKLMAFVDNCEEATQSFQIGAKILFLLSPLQGNFDSDEFVRVQKPLFDIFTKYADVTPVGAADLLEIINTGPGKYKYAFIPRMYHLAVQAYVPNKLEIVASLGRENAERASNRKREIITSVDICLVDISNNRIVFRAKSHRKRRVYGGSEFSWVSILTPDEWEEKWQDDQTERRLDRNAETLKRRLSTKLNEYLGTQH